MKSINDIKKRVENEYLNLTQNINRKIEELEDDNKTQTQQYKFLVDYRNKIDVAFARIDGFIEGTLMGLNTPQKPNLTESW